MENRTNKTIIILFLGVLMTVLSSCGDSNRQPVEVVVNGKSYQALYVYPHKKYWVLCLVDGTKLYVTGDIQCSRIDY